MNPYTKSTLRQLTKADLESELKNRGLDSIGTRIELHDRLRAETFPEDSNVTQNSSQTSSQNSIVTQLTANAQVVTDNLRQVNFIKYGPVFKRIPKASRLQSCNNLRRLG